MLGNRQLKYRVYKRDMIHTFIIISTIDGVRSRLLDGKEKSNTLEHDMWRVSWLCCTPRFLLFFMMGVDVFQGFHIITETMLRLISTPSVLKTYNAQTSLFPLSRKNGPSLTIFRQFQNSIVAWKKFQYYPGAKPMFPEKDYHKAEPRRDQDGNVFWPDPKSQIEKAKEFLREWSAAPSCYHANRRDENNTSKGHLS